MAEEIVNDQQVQQPSYMRRVVGVSHLMTQLAYLEISRQGINGVLLILVATLLCGTADAAWNDEGSRDALRNLLVAEGEAGPITIRRDDTRVLPALSPGARRLLFFDAYTGGSVEEPGQQAVFRVRSHPTIWRAYVDPQEEVIYKLFGFQGENGFSQVLLDYRIPVHSAEAWALAAVYVSSVYGARSEALQDVYAVRRFLMDELYRSYDGAKAEKVAGRLMSRRRRLIQSSLSECGVKVSGTGFDVLIMVGRNIDRGGKGELIEIRRLSMNLSSVEGLRVLEDTLITAISAQP